jgi:hypothetical protein
MNWGKWIVLSFILFAIFIGTLVIVCVRQNISLVATDYYKQEVNFQQQIDRIKNTEQLARKPEILISDGQLHISYVQFNAIQNGELTLFRPSNEASDMIFKLKVSSDSVQVFDLSAQQKGMYKAKMKWSVNSKEYYFEETVYL